jgi:hypothetical protein
MAYNYLKCRLDLDVSVEDTEKLGVVWDEVTFLTEPIAGKFGEFLIRPSGQLCHKGTEVEKVDESQAGQPGVIWGGTGYCRIEFMDWQGLSISENIDIRTDVLGKDADASIEIQLKVESGYVVSHTISKFDLIDNAPRKEHDRRIKSLAIERAKKMNTKRYRWYDSVVRKPLRCVFRGFGYIGSFIQDVTWKLERKLNKK